MTLGASNVHADEEKQCSSWRSGGKGYEKLELRTCARAEAEAIEGNQVGMVGLEEELVAGDGDAGGARRPVSWREPLRSTGILASLFADGCTLLSPQILRRI